jgi:acetate kinase
MILVLNCGSQSIKWKLFDKDLALVAKGERSVREQKKYLLILRQELGEVGQRGERIEIIGHRVVHGGNYKKPMRITENVLKRLAAYDELAPLHQPFNLLGIRVAREIFPEAEQFSVFDTSFFRQLPLVAKTYPLPENLRKKYSFRRFGFHGISHEYVAKEAAKKIKRPLSRLKIITCHLGGGASLAAIKNGKAIDVSMGFTPLEGLMMMTRCGNLDAGLTLFLMKKEKMDSEQMSHLLNEESGLKGICGQGEMLKVLAAIKKGDKKAKLALEMFIYSLQKYIGAYFAILGGCDVLIFTGAIGAGSEKIREMVFQDLSILKETTILAVKTDEELAIARKIFPRLNKK